MILGGPTWMSYKGVRGEKDTLEETQAMGANAGYSHRHRFEFPFLVGIVVIKLTKNKQIGPQM
jgi:hypothetical protein